MNKHMATHVVLAKGYLVPYKMSDAAAMQVRQRDIHVIDFNVCVIGCSDKKSRVWGETQATDRHCMS